jgi:hypothetical protein
MLRHSSLEPHQTLTRIADYFSGSPNFQARRECQRRSQTLFEMKTEDEIGLVYRFLRRGGTYTELAAEYQLSESYVSILVQNGIWIFALLWGSRYLGPFTCEDVLTFTPLKHRETGGLNIFLAGDCVESLVSDSGATDLHRLLYSSKVQSYTLKIFTLVTLGGLLVDRSFVLGGGATEVAGAHQVLAGSHFQSLLDSLPQDKKLVINLDRGFGVAMAPIEIPVDMRERVREWIPAFLDKRSEFLPTEIAESLVQNSLRSKVEHGNQMLEVHRSFKYPPLAMRSFYDAIAEVACAATNRKVMSRYSPSNRPFSAEQPLNRARLLLLHLYPYQGELHLPSGLLLTPHPAGPVPWPVEALLRQLLNVLSVDTFRHLTDRRQLAVNALLASSTTPAINFSRFLSPRMPDARALKLYRNNHVAQFQVGGDQHTAWCWAAVQASMRAVDHELVVQFALADGKLLYSECSCENGLAGYCSHVQAALAVLYDLKPRDSGWRRYVVTKQRSRLSFDKAEPLALAVGTHRGLAKFLRERSKTFREQLPVDCYWADTICSTYLSDVALHPEWGPRSYSEAGTR